MVVLIALNEAEPERLFVACHRLSGWFGFAGSLASQVVPLVPATVTY